ncbi:MAG: hypothetical protein EA396_03140 [Anaerolineaceae bacterium]|nr:MAG: hypothetical protein EA396_03140 [Anaerolineaceae bacterium]
MSEETRINKARERHQRRKRKRQSMAQAADNLRRRGTAGIGAGQMADWNGWRYVQIGASVIAGVLFMAVIVWAVGLFFDDDEARTPHNAIWLGADWTYEVHTDEQVGDLIDTLNRNRIGTVYARVSELNYDGTWTGRADGLNRFTEVESALTAFTSQFKTLAPQTRLYGTVFFRVDIGQDDGYRLDNPSIQALVADFSAEVVNDLGFDGVLLVVEPLWNESSPDMLDLLRLVRERIGASASLAVAVPPDWTPEDVNVPQTGLIAAGTVLDEGFKQRLALVGVDEIVVQAYNSYLNRADDYAAWMAYQVESYARAIGELGLSTRVLIGIPAYPSDLPAHDEFIEDISNALEGVRRGLAASGEAGEVIRGVAIYTERGMDDDAWDAYRRGWLNRD